MRTRRSSSPVDATEPARAGTVLAGAVLAGAVLAGCSAGDPPGAGDDVTASSMFGGEGGASGSGGGVLLDWEDRRFLIIAEETLVSRCMDEAGFEYVVSEPPLTLDAGGLAANPYGSDDVERLSAEGYGYDELPDDADRPVDANAQYVESLDPQRQQAFSLALFGDDSTARDIQIPGGATVSFNDDGCLAAARDDLYGDQMAWAQLFFAVENATGEITSRVYADERYQEAVAAWSDCMGEHGFEVTDPGEARDRAAEGYASLPAEEARRRELAIAGADSGCVVETGLLRIGRAVESEHAAELFGEREADVVAYREMQEAAIERAEELLGGT